MYIIEYHHGYNQYYYCRIDDDTKYLYRDGSWNKSCNNNEIITQERNKYGWYTSFDEVINVLSQVIPKNCYVQIKLHALQQVTNRA